MRALRFAIDFKTPQHVRENIAFNLSLGDGTDLYPPVVQSRMARATLAGSHLTLLLRCLRSGMKSSLIGTCFVVGDGDPDLKKVVDEGHSYWLLSEDITEEEAVLLSEWRNSDQNQNQCNSEMQLIKSIQRICTKELSLLPHASGQIKVAAIVQKVASTSCIRIPHNTIGNLSKFVLEMGISGYIDELASFHANCVNPSELSCSPSWYNDLTANIPKKYVLTRLNLAISQYNPECVTERMRPMPDNCKFISSAELATLGQSTDRELSFLSCVNRALR